MLDKVKTYFGYFITAAAFILAALVAYYKRKLFIDETITNNPKVEKEINKEQLQTKSVDQQLTAEEAKRKEIESVKGPDQSPQNLLNFFSKRK